MSLTAFILLTASVAAAADDLPAVVGRVVDAQHQPVAGADVYLFDGPPLGRAALFGLGGKTRQPPALVARAQTSDTGEFAVALPVEAPPLNGRGRTWLALAIHKSGLAVKTRLIGREWPARAAPVQLVLVPPRDNRVRVQSPGDEPMAHAGLRIDQIDGIALPAELSERLIAESDASGEAALPDVTGEKLRSIRIDSEQFGSQWAALDRPADGQASTVSLSPVGTISGQLIDDRGAPLRSTRIRLATWTEPRDELAGGGLADVTTDADGRFRVPVIAAGVLQMATELPRGSPLWSTYQGTQQVESGMSNDVVIRFRHGVAIHGTVIDQADRSPVAGAMVSLGLDPDAPVVECNEAGEYSGYVLPGQTYVTLARLPPDYYVPNGIIPLETVRDDAKEVTFKPLVAAAGAPLVGRVVDAAGQPVADAEVVGTCPRSDTGERNVYARSDREGNFLLPAMPTNANIRVTASCVAGISKNPAIGNTHDPDLLTVTIDPSGAISLSGRAIDANGRPIAGAAVRVLPVLLDLNQRLVDSGLVAFDGTERLYTDAAGRFITPKQLRSDRGYRLEVDALGMMPVRTEPIEPATWHTTDFGDMVLVPTPRLRAVAGQVVDELGQPIAGAVVMQSGDGPRRTRATCDANGRFRIEGIYEGPAWLRVDHEGFRLQAERIEANADEVRVVLRKRAVVPESGAPRASSADAADEDNVCRALFAEIRGRLEMGSTSDRLWVATTEFRLDGKLSGELVPDVVRQFWSPIAIGLSDLTHEQAVELAQATDETYLRGWLYLAAFDALGITPERQREVLAEALLAARAVNPPNMRIVLLGGVGERFFDLGDRDVGAAIVREAREQLAALPEDSIPIRNEWRGRFAAALAYLDAQGAIALAEKVRKMPRETYLADVARTLAAENPADAERALERMEMNNLRYGSGAGTVHRMAAVDPARAAQIARKFELPTSRAYGLGLIAEAQANSNSDVAETLIEEAYGILDQSLAEGTADSSYSTCGTAAALLVIVERVNPSMLDHYLARALAMRPPRPARGDPGAWYESEIAQMALAILPYDRQAARALLEPLAPRIRTLAAVGEQYAAPGQTWAAFALVDPVWARELVNRLPDAPPEAAVSPRATAARHVINVLVHRGAGRWPWIYQRFLHARHPDAPVRVR